MLVSTLADQATPRTGLLIEACSAGPISRQRDKSQSPSTPEPPHKRAKSISPEVSRQDLNRRRSASSIGSSPRRRLGSLSFVSPFPSRRQSLSEAFQGGRSSGSDRKLRTSAAMILSLVLIRHSQLSPIPSILRSLPSRLFDYPVPE